MTSPRGRFLAALPRFAEMLGARLDAGTPTSEDGVRYTLFATLLLEGLEPGSVVPEFPHPAISNARLDTVILDREGRPAVALEFKYDPSAQAMTQRAGSAIADLERLGRCPPWDGRFFVYLTGTEMTRYLESPTNRLANLLDQPRGARLSRLALEGHAETLRRGAGEILSNPILNTILRKQLSKGHAVRALEVTND